tara:strand:+ start:157 stop:489 length:333 start_codon:yes stop_codon:yes gene_type:complete
VSGIGFWELIILFLIGLIVLGPKRLPQVANQLGEWIGQAKRMTRVMRRQLEEEIELDNPMASLPYENQTSDKSDFFDTTENLNERIPEPPSETQSPNSGEVQESTPEDKS